MKILILIFLIASWLSYPSLAPAFPPTLPTEGDESPGPKPNTKPNTKPKKETVKKDSPAPSQTLDDFILKEVIPSFGTLENILLTNKPSFKMRFTGKGAQLEECFLSFRLKQMRPMNYNIAHIEVYDFPVSAAIGTDRWLFFEMKCGDKNQALNIDHYHLSFFITDGEFKKAPYHLKVKLMEQEQIDVQFWSLDVEALIHNKKEDVLVGFHGNVMEWEKAFSSYKKGKEYLIPVSAWPPLKDKMPPESVISARRIETVKRIDIKGSARLFLPTFLENVKNNTEVQMPVKGSIFISDEGETIPVIDFWLE